MDDFGNLIAHQHWTDAQLNANVDFHIDGLTFDGYIIDRFYSEV